MEGAFLNDEPQTLLRIELREPSVYNSILEAISNGCNKVCEIADRIHEEKSKCSKYMLTLQTLRLIEKCVPCTEPETSKKGIYEITDNYYKFWYRFLFTNQNYYSMLGLSFPAKKLPFIPYKMGKWWGNNPLIKAQDDVDILAFDKTGKKVLLCECKFRNKPMPMEEYDDLVMAAEMFKNAEEKYLMFFSKSGFTESVKERAARENAVLLTIEDLY